MIDNLLNFGSAFDWLSPLFAFFLDFYHGSASHFGIEAFTGWDRRDIKRLLKMNGIRVWGLMYNFEGDTLMFTVPIEQAADAYQLLQSAGVSILYAPVGTAQYW